MSTHCPFTGTSLLNHLKSLGFTVDDDHDWGYQLRAVNEAEYCLKFLILTNGRPGSLHHHGEFKKETFICLAGSVEVETPGELGLPRFIVLVPGNVLHIGFCRRHRMRALRWPAVLAEVSTHDDDAYTFRIGD